MGIKHESLDDEIRQFMVSELEMDIFTNRLYLSPRLTKAGATSWPVLLEEALKHHDDDWLADKVRSRGLLRAQEPSRLKNGGYTLTKVPENAPETLSEGEFNRFYIRGLCLSVMSQGGSEVEVYRGKEVIDPRSESLLMIGKRIRAQPLLRELRFNNHVDPVLGLPPGPNSGLTARRLSVEAVEQ